MLAEFSYRDLHINSSCLLTAVVCTPRAVRFCLSFTLLGTQSRLYLRTKYTRRPGTFIVNTNTRLSRNSCAVTRNEFETSAALNAGSSWRHGLLMDAAARAALWRLVT